MHPSLIGGTEHVFLALRAGAPRAQGARRFRPGFQPGTEPATKPDPSADLRHHSWTVDSFASASPHWGEFFEIHVSSQREERLLVRRKIPGRRFRLTRRNLACSPISTEARCTEVKSGGLDLMRPPIGRSPPPALPSQLPLAVQPIRRFLLFSWL